jgi:glutamine cyclotransferase
MTRIDLSPIGTAQQIKDPWGSRWFKEDRCRGPGNVFMVEPSGDVKPCCGYASDSKEFTIGNIRKDTARDMIRRFDKEGVPGSIFRIGLSRIRKRLEKLGIKFPGRSDNHCFFCSYILTKIPRKILNRAILACLLAALLVSQSWAEQSMARKSEDCRQIKFSVKQKIELPKWYHEGLFIDGDSMLVANGNGGKIWRVDTASGKVTSQIRSPSGFTEAIAKMPGGGYMLTDWDDEKLYKIKFTGTDIAIEGVLFDFTPAHPAGAVIAGGRIFVIVWTRGLGTRFDIIELDKDIKEVSRIRVMDFQEPAHMAWDGRYLWITSWYDRNVYKVNPDTWTIISYFRAPCNKPTGIAWDGKYIWITGTYADLYKVELESASD